MEQCKQTQKSVFWRNEEVVGKFGRRHKGGGRGVYFLGENEFLGLGFLDDLIFRNKAVLSSRANEVWTRLSMVHRGWDG